MKSLSVKIGDSTYFVDMFNMGDMETIYLKKNEIEHASKNYGEDKAIKLYNEFVDNTYPDIPKYHREYVFIYNIVASEGKTDYKLTYKCPKCSSESISIFKVLTNEEFYYRSIQGVFELVFDYIDSDTKQVYDIDRYIYGVRFGKQIIRWDNISEETKENILSYIPTTEAMDIFEDIQMCRSTLKTPSKKCCEESPIIIGEHKIIGGYNIFDILINSKNLVNMYQVNHQLLNRGISLNDQSRMKPFERSIYVNMIIKQEKEEMERHESNRISRH